MTEIDIYTYRELYYEHVKPLLRQGADCKMIDILMEPVFEDYGWTKEKFQAFQLIDLMQRLQSKDNSNIAIMAGDRVLDVNMVTTDQMLRCPRRTEQFKLEEEYNKQLNKNNNE